MDSALSWQEFQREQTRPTLAIDLPGFGESDLAGSDKYLDSVRLLDKIISKAGVDRYHLVGHSLGAALATGLADRYENVLSLTLISSAGFGPMPVLRLVNQPLLQAALLRVGPLAMHSRHLVSFAYSNIFSWHEPIDEALLARILADRNRVRPATRAGLAMLREVNDQPFNDINFSGPVLAIWGDHDQLTPYRKEAIVRAFPAAKIVCLCLAGVGHHPQYEERARVSRALTKHLLQPQRQMQQKRPEASSSSPAPSAGTKLARAEARAEEAALPRTSPIKEQQSRS